MGAGGGGGGGPVPWGRRHWVGIYFCHPEVMKLQQQCHRCRILFLIYPPTGSILFFFWERESANISWRQQQENWKEKCK